MKKLRAITNEPQHPADEQDEAIAGDVDSIAARQTAANDIRSFLSNAPPGNRAEQPSAKKPKDKNNVPVNRVDNAKKMLKSRSRERTEKIDSPREKRGRDRENASRRVRHLLA